MSDHAYSYTDAVAFDVAQDDSQAYVEAAAFLNDRAYGVLSIQHEYGIYGGESGEYLLRLVRSAKMPVVTTLHTVMRNPSASQRRILDELLQLSERVVVMSRSAIELLFVVHGVDISKVDFIPHGIPRIPAMCGAELRCEVTGDGPILLTFGLLSPDKGIQSVIGGLPLLAEQFPDTKYLVVGATHPHELARNGESYRDSLVKLSRNLGVERNIEFVNEFVSVEKVIEYLDATDYYITPYLNPLQITSGTLAYSMGAGKVVISTPYVYAQEVLADGRGILVPFGDSEAIAISVIRSWSNPVQSDEMRSRALAYGQDMDWDTVGERYMRSFERAFDGARCLPKPVEVADLRPRTVISLDHVEKLTDDTGIFQHATFSVPNRFEGYCVDDNARALLLTVMLEAEGRPNRLVSLLQARYLAFVAHSLDPETGRFRNFMSYDRTWLEDVGSEDSQGRALWALGYTVAHCRHETHVLLAEKVFQAAANSLSPLTSPRACAYAVLGIAAFLEAHPDSESVRSLLTQLGLRLQQLYAANATIAWPWMEARLSYANARIPQAMMIAGEALDARELISGGMTSLTWLMDHQVAPSGCFSPVGSQGAGPSDLGSVQFDQQPVEVWSSVSACITAARFGLSEKFLKRSAWCFEWFLGGNVLGRPVAESGTGACCDGLEQTGLNRNQGAESTLSYLCAHAELSQAVGTFMPSSYAQDPS